MAIDAEYIVRRARELCQVFGSSLQFRDGFTSDVADATATPILPAANEYLYKLARTGYLRKYFSLSAVASTPSYTLPLDCRKPLSVYFNNKPLQRASREGLDVDYPEWRTTAGIPKRYLIEGRTLTLYPVPNGTGAITVWGEATPPLLEQQEDTPEGMADAQAIRLPFGIALTIAVIDDNNPSHVARRQKYEQEAGELMQELEAMRTQPDDFASVSLDNYVAVPTVSPKQDGE